MIGKLIKTNRTYLRAAALIRFLRRVDIKLWYVLLPVMFSFLSALFDGLSVGLLIPLIDGVIKGTFEAAYKTPVLKTVLEVFPQDITAKGRNIFVIAVFLTFTAAVLNQVMRYMSVLSMSFFVRRMANNLRKNIFDKYVDQGKGYFDANTYGHLNTILQDFTNNVAGHLSIVNSRMADILVIFVFVGMMFALSWQITLGVMVAVPFMNKVSRVILTKIRHASMAYSEKAKDLQKKSFDILSCMPLVMINAAQEEEKKEYYDISDRIESVEKSLDKKTGIIEPLHRVFMLGIVLVVITLLAVYVETAGAAQISRMAVYLYLLREVSLKIGVINYLKGLLARILGPVREIKKVLDMTDIYEIKSGTRQFESIGDKIEIRGLDFEYAKGKKVLRNISFDVLKNATTAIVGPTGSGKTTIISLILRLYECPPGSIWVDGKDIREFELRSLMRKMALVSQETYLFDDTLRKNITYGQDNVTEEKLENAVKKARLDDFINSLPQGLDTAIGDRGTRVSGGEKQRVSIARALLKNAEILVLDEATSSLDSRTESLVQSAIEDMVQGKTVIVIAHRLSTIKHADKIVVIEDGRKVEEGTLEELLEKEGKFYGYWQEQKFD